MTRLPIDSPWPGRVREVLRCLAVEEPSVAAMAGRAAVLLHGSTTRGIDDAYSDLDVWLLPPDEHPSRFIQFTTADKPGHANIESRPDFEARVRRCDFPLLYELRHALILDDPDGWAGRLIARASRPMPTEVRQAWFAYHYIEMRGHHRACDNPISRNDASALLLALTATLTHALQAAMILDGEPYPYSKWLAVAAAETPTGRQIVPSVNDVIAAIGRGALNEPGPETQHPLTLHLKQIRRRLVTAARSAGLDAPWLVDWYLHLELRGRIRDVSWQ